MSRIATNISEGAMAFLKAEYKVLAIFVGVVALLMMWSGTTDDSHPLVALSFVLGAICSGLAGFIGMKVGSSIWRRSCHGNGSCRIRRSWTRKLVLIL